MPKLETHFLVPIHEDADVGSGDLHPTNRWEELQRDLFTMFKGWTSSPGLFEGEYPDPDTGKPIHDKSVMYIVAIEEEVIPKLRKYLSEKVAVRFRQKVIYFFNGKEVDFIESIERQTEPGI
jgi:hypothetical protein